MSGNGVIVVGAINVDFVVATDRLPGPGETVVGAGMARHGGGKGANAAVAAARAGATVRLVGAVGADDTGVAALNELRAEGIAVDDVAVLDGEPAGVALIVVDAEGENQIAVGAGANMAGDPDRVRAALREALPTAGCVLVSTEIPPGAVAAAVEAASRTGAPVVVTLGGDGVLVVGADGQPDHVHRARPRSGTPPVPATASTGCSRPDWRPATVSPMPSAPPPSQRRCRWRTSAPAPACPPPPRSTPHRATDPPSGPAAAQGRTCSAEP